MIGGFPGAETLIFDVNLFSRFFSEVAPSYLCTFVSFDPEALTYNRNIV